jgi:lysophospholipase L1-like esterase
VTHSRRLVSALATVALVTLVAAAPAATPRIPGSMAAVGDSITRGFNACGFYFSCMSRSWSTGGSIASHYVRIRAKNPAIAGRAFNDAQTGAEVADLNGQVQAAVAQRVQYVTILIGANDACTATEAGMTPVATFATRFRRAMTTLANGRPGAAVFVASIPDLERLWQVGRTSRVARAAWRRFDTCRSMLARPTSTAPADVARRNRVRQRVIDYNATLAQVCAEHATCEFDDNAVFDYRFTLRQVSGWDYFHPNTAGQQALARITYAAGFGW